ncbi:MAG: hypothetical protein JXR23_07460 [Pontiellaceae bacterium]|nr:hypothetical protein [Pontiellaceae bacterium]
MNAAINCIIILTLIITCHSCSNDCDQKDNSSSEKKRCHRIGLQNDSPGWGLVLYINGDPLNMLSGTGNIEIGHLMKEGTNSIRIVAEMDSDQGVQYWGSFRLFKYDVSEGIIPPEELYSFNTNDINGVIDDVCNVFLDSTYRVMPLDLSSTSTILENINDQTMDEIHSVIQRISSLYLQKIPYNSEEWDDVSLAVFDEYNGTYNDEFVSQLYSCSKLIADIVDEEDLVLIPGKRVLMAVNGNTHVYDAVHSNVLFVASDRDAQAGDVRVDADFMLFVYSDEKWKMLR